MTEPSDLPGVTGEINRLVGDLRKLLANRELDSIPELRQLRERLDGGVQTMRDAADDFSRAHGGATARTVALVRALLAESARR